MRKWMALVLALALCASMTFPAFAADITQDSEPTSGSTTVAFHVAPTYTVTIPDAVTLERKVAQDGTATYEQQAEVTATNVRLNEGNAIQVTLASDFTLSDGATNWTYAVTVGDSSTPVKSNAVVATFGSDPRAQSVTLHFAAADPTYAGRYTDTVTFTVSTVTAAPGEELGGGLTAGF